MHTTSTFSKPVRFTYIGFLKDHTLAVFFAMVFAFTWPFLIVDALGSQDILPFRLPIPLLIVMGYMPSLAALTVTSLTLGKVGLVTLLKRLIRWRVGWGWYAVAIGGYALLCLAVIPEYALLGGAPALPLLSAQAAKLSPLSLLGMVCLILIVSTLINGEELAWRGFALPRLQARYGSLKASLILGVVWAVFHLPLFWTVGASQFGQSFWGLLIGAVSLSVLLTWVYNHTQGSLLLACLIHASANTWTQVFPIDHAAPLVGWLLSANTALAALLVILAYGPRLVRKSSQSN